MMADEPESLSESAVVPDDDVSLSNQSTLLSPQRQITTPDNSVSVSNQSTLLSPQRQILNVPMSMSTERQILNIPTDATSTDHDMRSTDRQSELPYW